MSTAQQMTEPQSLATTQVNFYILADADAQNRLQFVFRLVEKAAEKQLITLILAADKEQLAELDRLIWTAKPERFIAHEMISEGMKQPLPTILLTDNMAKLAQLDFSPQVVIDLGHDASPLNYPKIMLVANQDTDVLPNARMKYQAYINNGIKPNVHKIG